MPSPVAIPEYLKRTMVSFRALPAVIRAFHKHVPKNQRSRWLEQAMIDKLTAEGVKINYLAPNHNGAG